MGSISIRCIKESDPLIESILYYRDSILIGERRIVASGQAHASKSQLWDLRKKFKIYKEMNKRKLTKDELE
jgi:hypothetical protein